MSTRPGFYLVDHPPARPQFNWARREPISGVAVIHTFEGLFDDAGPDTGAELGSLFIAQRTDAAGSYHELGDSDSSVPLVPDDAESFQVAVDGHNRHAWGYSFTCRTSDLHPSSPWTRRAFTIAGVRIAAFWARNGFCIAHSARFLTNAQVADLRAREHYCTHRLRVGGLTTHGDLQPADRSDAFTRHPHRVALEQLLLDAIVPEEDIVTPEDIEQIARRVTAHLASPAHNPGTVIDPGARNALAAIHVAVADPKSGLRAILLAQQPGGTVDVAGLAAQIVDQLDRTDARAVADELARRLAS